MEHPLLTEIMIVNVASRKKIHSELNFVLDDTYLVLDVKLIFKNNCNCCDIFFASTSLFDETRDFDSQKKSQIHGYHKSRAGEQGQRCRPFANL